MGVVESPARAGAGIVIHVGPTVRIGCRRAGQHHRGGAVHGDVDIVPPFVASRWELDQPDTALLIGVPPASLSAAAQERGLDPARVEIVNRFQIRDPQIEHIGWALKSAAESEQLFRESLATALAARLVDRHSSAARAHSEKIDLSGKRLRAVIGYIEDHPARDLSLGELAAVAGIGVSQLTAAFRQTTGIPVHRYVIGRRVERALTMLRETRLPVAHIAAEAGFAHQSHLARHMRRVLGVSPGEFRANVSGWENAVNTCDHSRS